MATKFRETTWFKMGEQAAEEAEAAAASDGDEAQPSATFAMLPLEDRYSADASAHDTKTFGLHTGMTDRMKALKHISLPEDEVSMKSLVREMKKTKRNVLIGAGAAALCVAFALYIF